MENKNYIKWFLSIGWKSYGLAFFILVVVNLAYFLNFNLIVEESDSFLIVVLMTMVLITASIAMIYHSYDAYKNTKE